MTRSVTVLARLFGPSHPGFAYPYIVSAIAGFLANLLGLLVSLAGGLGSKPPAS